MTDRDEIIRMAHEAEIGDSHGYIIRNELAHLERFAALIEDAYRQRLLAGVGEPVAWTYQNRFTDQHYLTWDKGNGGKNWQPLYTADQLAASVARERDLLGKANALARIRAKRIAELKAEVQIAVAREREECAKVAESLPPLGDMRQLQRATASDCAAAIRARSKATPKQSECCNHDCNQGRDCPKRKQ